ncbi:CehA/McbA family metallohydrolase [Agromyces seonyuensis]|uniref:PHP domain-containing protein n=1 Tax=Agromyces seonyuensis TaxID=2662446 RepID=A0A6I4P2H3_9MICO|nr:CehA/McbA family metallohydrolase [Agromyces seonyuensis]MWB98925.1 PHP domain-containing protein [Agromyces seonyuensis]
MATTHRLQIGIDVQLESRYLELPFAHPGGRSVEVTLEFDRSAAEIDLGVRDPERWRGWSGGARMRFAITPDAATPGYEAGPLPAGEWAVVLGLYKVPAEPIDVVVTIEAPASAAVEADPPAPPRPDAPRGSARSLPAPDGLTWFAGDFHAHTLHSDGELSIAQLSAAAAARGLDFLAVTDHNTVSHHPHLPAVASAYDLALLPGQEVTTHRGHANAFGDIGWIDFREPPSRWVEEVAERGGVLSINHPLDGEWAWLHPLEQLPPALEFWHITWFRELTATGPWALLPRWRPDVTLIGGSDFHHAGHGYPPGTPTTWVAAADRSPEAILEALAAGRTAISRYPGAGEAVLVRVGSDLVALDADGAVLVDSLGRSRRVHGDRAVFDAEAAGVGPFRLETPARELLAISR